MAVLHTRAVWSIDEVRMRWPSGLNATPETPPVWPRKVSGSPVPSAFHTRTVLSYAAEATRSPSGLNATPKISAV